MKNLRIALLFIMCLVLISCEKSEESVKAEWESNVERVNSYIKDYPVLEKNLSTDLNYAKSKYEKALKIENPEQRIEAIDEANAFISLKQGFKQDFIKIQIGDIKAIKVLLEFDEQKDQLAKKIDNVETYQSQKLTDIEKAFLEKSKEMLQEAERFKSMNDLTEQELLAKMTAYTEKMEKEIKLLYKLGAPEKKKDAVKTSN